MLYVVATNAGPKAAACNTSRISPVARETTVPSAINADDRANPPEPWPRARRAACRPRRRVSTLPAFADSPTRFTISPL
ncbi:hypothetical protein [Kitasatospora sp. MAA4]|uniref:hypothetical protein n=1 Tax=Kitasatospora sp. MAA4 TaxID=3035093 RepID=UPI002476721D|nr:hypothetical protein [Kitasatospora sp. MAA4]